MTASLTNPPPVGRSGFAPVSVLLSDGSIAVLRSVTPDDGAALVALHRDVSIENRYRRFFGFSASAGDSFVSRIIEPGRDIVAIAVQIGDRVVALGTAEPVSSTSADLAMLVADDCHGRGVGTLLLQHLASVGRSRGWLEFQAVVLATNTPMLQMLRSSGFDLASTSDAGDVELLLSLEASEEAAKAAMSRERTAEQASLRPLLRPSSIAVAGVSTTSAGVGHAILSRLRSRGYNGDVFVLHPTEHAFGDVPAAASVSDLPAVPDLLLVAVPAAGVGPVVADAAEAGVGAIVVVTAGLGESGVAGAARQRELVELCRRHGSRLVGPNCIGVSIPPLGVEANFMETECEPGTFAIASQSGGVGIALLSAARDRDLGVAAFLSLGNKADVSGNDLLAAWTDDPGVGVAALYLESFGNPLKFARVARAFSERKPLLAAVGGASQAGGRAGASHTAAAASPRVAVQALLRQAGVIEVHDTDELVQTAELLTRQPLPQGGRVAIIGNAGGLGVIGADAAERHRLLLPELSPDALRSAGIGPEAGVNPVDLGAAATPPAMLRAVGAIAAGGEVDAIVVCCAATAVNDVSAIMDAAVTGGLAGSQEVPLLAVLVGRGVDRTRIRRAGVPVYSTPEDALRALGHASRYHAWRATPVGSPVRTDRAAKDTTQKLAASLEAGWQEPGTIRQLFDTYGVRAPVGQLCTGEPEVRAAASGIDGTIVMKVADPAVVHRTELHLVETSLDGVEAAAACYQGFAHALQAPDLPVLVQPKVAGTEIAVGVVRDERFGPLVMVAAGGTAVDLWNDRVFLLPPINDLEVGRALRQLRVWPLLEGYRGQARADIEGLQRLVRGVGSLVVDLPELAELDLNPVIVTADGVACVDAKMRLAAQRISADDPAAPHLRRLS